jgi:hypothetical protein
MKAGVITLSLSLLLAAGLAAGCTWLSSPTFKNYTDENEYFKCILDVGYTAGNAPSTIRYTFNCMAKKGKVELRNVKFTYSDRSSYRSNRYARGSRVLAESEPFGDQSILITPDRPFSYNGSITPRGLLVTRLRRMNLSVHSNVFYPDDPLSEVDKFNELDADRRKNPSKYNMGISKGL